MAEDIRRRGGQHGLARHQPPRTRTTPCPMVLAGLRGNQQHLGCSTGSVPNTTQDSEPGGHSTCNLPPPPKPHLDWSWARKRATQPCRPPRRWHRDFKSPQSNESMPAARRNCLVCGRRGPLFLPASPGSSVNYSLTTGRRVAVLVFPLRQPKLAICKYVSSSSPPSCALSALRVAPRCPCQRLPALNMDKGSGRKTVSVSCRRHGHGRCSDGLGRDAHCGSQCDPAPHPARRDQLPLLGQDRRGSKLLHVHRDGRPVRHQSLSRTSSS